jgi:4-amino-4-deoxy-L-arabinose transferase-like glycosyltransferase
MTKRFLAAFILLAAARIAIAVLLPITDDEAYYWIWSQHLSWGYPDHPPVIAGLIWLSTSVLGDGPMGIRLGALVMTLATGVIVYALGRDMFGPKVGAVAALTSQLLPVIAAGGAVAVPDAPFMFLWLLTVWLFWRALGTGAGAWWWYAAGAALGLTAMSKVFGILLALGFAGFLLTSPVHRNWLRRSEPYAAAAIAAGVFAPFVLWNAAEGWPSWLKIRQQIPWIKTGSPASKTLAYVLAQFAYYGPLTAPLLLFALRTGIRRPYAGDPRFALLGWASLPVLIMSVALSPNGMPKPHWPAPAYVLAALAAAALWWESRRVEQRLLTGGLGLNAVILGLILLAPAIAPRIMDQAKGWEQVTAQVVAVADAMPPGPGVFIFSTGYQTASQLTYRLRGAYPVTAASTNTLLSRVVPLQDFIGWNAVYVDDDREPIAIPIERMFQRVERLPKIRVLVDGRVTRLFYLYRGTNFLGLTRTRRNR